MDEKDFLQSPWSVKNLMKLLIRAFHSSFSIDLRSLALFRILTGIIAVYDVIEKSFWADSFYTDFGILPRAIAISKFTGPYLGSLYFAQGTKTFVLILMAIQALLGVALIVGWNTRKVSIGVFILVSSLDFRNRFILTGADDVLRVMLFWTMFVPVGARYSWDARKKISEESNSYYSSATVSFILQILIIYLFTALLKSGPSWRTDFTAVFLATHITTNTTSLALWLSSHYELTKFLTAFTFIIEAAGPLIYFLTYRGRLVTIILFIALHGSMCLLFNLGKFPYVCMTCWIALLPSETWQSRPFKFLNDKLLLLSSKIKLATPPVPVNLRPGYSGLLTLPLIAFVTVMNLTTVLPWFRLPEPYLKFVASLGLVQRWSMYSPDPIRREGWIIPEGTLSDGSSMDLWTFKPLSLALPERLSSRYANLQWRRLNDSLESTRGELFRSMAAYYCRLYSRASGQRYPLDTVRFHYLWRIISLPGETEIPMQSAVLWTQSCHLTVPTPLKPVMPRFPSNPKVDDPIMTVYPEQ